MAAGERRARRAPRPSVGDELELRIDSLAFGGAGVARTEGGYVVFVDGAFPGDLVRARVRERKRSHAKRACVEVLEAGPDRVPPLAAIPARPWQELRYERQLEVKQEQVDEALRRIGHLEGFELEPIVAGARALALPQQARVLLRRRRGRRRSSAASTRPARGSGSSRSRTACWPRSAATRPAARCSTGAARTASRRSIAAPREGFLRNLVVREGRSTGELQVRLVTAPGELDGASLAGALAVDGLLWSAPTRVAETTAGGTTELLAGSALLHERIGGLELALSPEAFFQTNTEMAERLYELVVDAAGLHGWERVFDLYCGVGAIGLSLARRAGTVHGLEIVERGGHRRDPQRARQRDHQRHFHAGDVRLVLRELVERLRPPRPHRRRPAARGPLAEDRPPHHRGGAASGSSTSRATRRRSRPTPRRSSRRAGGCERVTPWTCSPRPRISSAWRCSPDDRGDHRDDGEVAPSRASRPRARARARCWSACAPPGSTAPT